MKKAEIERLKALCDNATREPWIRHMPSGFIYSYFENEREHMICRIGDALPYCRDDDENGEFIITARTAMPELIQEVERLRGLLADAVGLAIPENDDPVFERIHEALEEE